MVSLFPLRQDHRARARIAQISIKMYLFVVSEHTILLVKRFLAWRETTNHWPTPPNNNESREKEKNYKQFKALRKKNARLLAIIIASINYRLIEVMV
jgi:hypothetical protein